MPCVVNSVCSDNDKFCFALRIEGELKKICLITFKKGGVFISFPYYLDTKGQLGMTTLPGGRKHFDKAPDPRPLRYTTHNVKFHHHADGRCFFSEDGKIFSTHWLGIETRSFPVHECNGHFGTILLQGTDVFETTDDTPVSHKKYHPIACCFSKRKDDAYKILFHCYASQEKLLEMLKPYEHYPEVPPYHTVKFENGRVLEEWFLMDKSQKIFFVISAEQLPRLKEENYPVQMSFIGGFDTNIKDMESDTSFLFLAYPIRQHFDELVSKFGSADYQPGSDPIRDVRAAA